MAPKSMYAALRRAQVPGGGGAPAPRGLLLPSAVPLAPKRVQVQRLHDEMTSAHILHSDVRPWNLLVCNDGLDVVLADFDIGHVLPFPEVTVRPRCALPPSFRSPEDVATGERHCWRIGLSADIWMLGVSFAMLATPVLPGKHPVHWRLDVTRLGRAEPMLDSLRPCVSAAFFNVIESCLHPETERPTSAELVRTLQASF